MAEKEWIGDADEGAVHLEIENLPNASVSQALEQAAVHQREQRAAVAIGTDKQPARRFQEELTGGPVEGRHGSLAKEKQLVRGKPKIAVLLKKPARLGVRGGARHDQEGDGLAVAPAEGEHFLRMDLKQALPGDRARREHPLWMVESQPCPLASRDHQGRNFA